MKEPKGGEDRGTDETEKCLNNFKQRFEHKLREPKFALEVAGFLVLAVYAGFTIAMYFANRKAANAAQQSADYAGKALIASNRSWLELELEPPWNDPLISEHLKELTDLSFKVRFTNVGKIPSKKIVIESKVIVLDRNEASSFDYHDARRLWLKMLFPQRYRTFAAILPAPENPIVSTKVSSALRDQLKGGDKYIVIFARGTFTDEFGAHTLNFCRYLAFTSASYNSPSCVDYNDTGDVPEKEQP